MSAPAPAAAGPTTQIAVTGQTTATANGVGPTTTSTRNAAPANGLVGGSDAMLLSVGAALGLGALFGAFM